MSYKIMDGGFCVDKGIDRLEVAKDIASDYCCDAEVGIVTIEDESTGKTVMTGHATTVMQWTES